MSLSQEILDVIVSFISKRKRSALERAFRKDQKFINAIKRLDTSYVQMKDIVDDYCKRNPDACKSWDEKDKITRGM